ncbi:atypical membrane-integrating protein (Mistic protein) [Alteribacillus sp. YIM 98480]|uniref:atypical membrane-integrating protein (Mistic protein) n=1 Tax=Alteribacillus sp. YIM 98480 TaxID=2606599 RepID=UPI00131BC819|nr:atypical membrane-integrating protein (Mistic protein) [Alteribacillus sp. YIM 98480]
MKANENDHHKYSEAIDKIQEGNNAMIELFNELEDDDPLIRFGDDVMENIEKAKKKFGDDVVDEKINTVVREMLSWLDLNDVE